MTHEFDDGGVAGRLKITKRPLFLLLVIDVVINVLCIPILENFRTSSWDRRNEEVTEIVRPWLRQCQRPGAVA